MNLTEKFLNEIAEIMEILNIYNTKSKINPKILITSSLMVVFLVAFSKTLYFALAATTYLLLMITILKVDIKVIAKIIMLALFLSMIPAIPIAISKTGYVNSLNDLGTEVTFEGARAFIIFVLRVTMSSGIFAVPIVYFGWSKVLAYFENWKYLDSITNILKIFVTTVPKMLRHMLSLLVAREARIFNNSLRNTWRSLSTIVGDVLLASSSFSKELMLGINARTFDKYKVQTTTSNNGSEHLNIVVVVATIALGILFIAVEIFGIT